MLLYLPKGNFALSTILLPYFRFLLSTQSPAIKLTWNLQLSVSYNWNHLPKGIFYNVPVNPCHYSQNAANEVVQKISTNNPVQSLGYRNACYIMIGKFSLIKRLIRLTGRFLQVNQSYSIAFSFVKFLKSAFCFTSINLAKHLSTLCHQVKHLMH